jgi:hypothetical protein
MHTTESTIVGMEVKALHSASSNFLRDTLTVGGVIAALVAHYPGAAKESNECYATQALRKRVLRQRCIDVKRDTSSMPGTTR